MTTFPTAGISKDEIFASLNVFKGSDLPWQSGRILAYTYHPGEEPLEVAADAYRMFLSENGLDPTTFPSMHKLEMDIVGMLRDLMRGDDAVVGSCTSGGTESNLIAMKAVRDWCREHKPHITEPEMVVPRTAHPSFHKACQYFGITPVITPFDPVTYQADVGAMRDAINENTIVLIASASGYAQGVVDSVPEIGQLALDNDLHFHVDACVGGIHLSLWRRMGGYKGPEFDMSVPGVTSISADLHKYGYAPKNISTVLYKNKELRRYAIFSCRATTTYALINPTILSTKSGGPLAGAWALLHYLGEEGYRDIVGPVMDATRRFIDGINAIDGLRVLGDPEMCMFSFASDEVNIFELGDAVRARGWYVQPQFSTDQSPANLHITVVRASVPHVDDFLTVLREAMDEVRANPNPIDLTMVREQVQRMVAGMGADAADQIRGLAGMDDGDLPEGMAMINSVLDALPDEMANMLLTEFINDLYV